MVFIHGGSFVAGSKDAPIYDGSAFARDGVVCVTINYRMGIEGFLPIPGVPTNIGLRDMIAALEGIKSNIAAFGGDADNVTLFGESGGAFCIAALMVSPLAGGLFHRAICQSGHILLSRDLSVMRKVVDRLAKQLRVPRDRAGFLSRHSKQLLAAQDRVMQPSLWLDMRDADGRDPSYGITRFMPQEVHGDDMLPQPMIDALRGGAGKHIDLLIGTTSEEANLFTVPGNVRGKLRRWVVQFALGRALPKARAALRAYGLDKKGAKPGDVFTRALTDLMFRWMARRTAEAASRTRLRLPKFTTGARRHSTANSAAAHAGRASASSSIRLHVRAGRAGFSEKRRRRRWRIPSTRSGSASRPRGLRRGPNMNRGRGWSIR